MPISQKRFKTIPNQIQINTKSDVFFISDVHLNPRQNHLEKSWSSFTHQVQSHQPAAIFIIGDLLDAWISPGHCQTNWLSSFKNSLQTMGKTSQIYFLPGNRDCLLSEKECASMGIHYLPDPTIVTVNDKKILLCHGDWLCHEDTLHLLFRQVLDWNLAQKLIKHTPKIIIDYFIQLIKSISSRHKSNIGPLKQDISLNSADQTCLSHQIDYFVHGHTHKIEDAILPLSKSRRINLGFWAENHVQYWSFQNSQLVAYSLEQQIESFLL